MIVGSGCHCCCGLCSCSAGVSFRVFVIDWQLSGVGLMVGCAVGGTCLLPIVGCLVECWLLIVGCCCWWLRLVHSRRVSVRGCCCLTVGVIHFFPLPVPSSASRSFSVLNIWYHCCPEGTVVTKEVNIMIGWSYLNGTLYFKGLFVHVDSSVPDPDLSSRTGIYVFGSPGSGSVIICKDPNPFHHQTKKISFFQFCDLLITCCLRRLMCKVRTHCKSLISKNFEKTFKIKNSNKTLEFYCFVTSLWLFIVEEWCKCTFKKE